VQPIVLREARKALETGRPKLLTISPESTHEDWKGVESYRMTCEGGGSLEIYLEPVLPKPELLIVGNSPVAQIVSELGRLLDFNVVVADPQANKDQFPGVDLILTDLTLARSRINEASFVVVATMGNGDEEGLQAVAGTTPKYLGLVASEKKAKSLFEYLQGKGITSEQIANIRCPAGLELGGETLPEIALSIVAEITSVRRTNPVTSEAALKSTALPVMTSGVSDEVTGVGSLEAIDPICGMTVEIKGAKYTSIFGDNTFYFCCLRCKEAFDQSVQSSSSR
jgi:xanthine dehydrogenase accessory factor